MTICVIVRPWSRVLGKGLSKIERSKAQTDRGRCGTIPSDRCSRRWTASAARARGGKGEVLSVAAEIRVPVLGLAWVGAARCGAGRWGAARSGAATRCRLGLVGGSSATAGCTIASAESKPMQEIKALFMTRPRSCLKYPINEA